MWRLWHKLLGWHYVAIKYGHNHAICRVEVDGDGHMYVRVSSTHIDLQQQDEVREWYPLTFRRVDALKAKRTASPEKSARKKVASKTPA